MDVATWTAAHVEGGVGSLCLPVIKLAIKEGFTPAHPLKDESDIRASSSGRATTDSLQGEGAGEGKWCILGTGQRYCWSQQY